MSTKPPLSPSSPKASFIRALLIELERWKAEGIIDADIVSRIVSRYPEVKPVDWRGRLVTVLSVMAATLLGLGVIMFFAANWEEMPRWGKLGLIIAIMSGTYVAGYVLRYEREFPKVGGSVIFLGTILYGAAIFLVAQAFNIREHFPNGMLLWAAGILPMVLVAQSPYILCLFTLVFCAWSGTETFAFDNFGIFPLLVILGVILPLAYYYKHRVAVAFGIAALAWFSGEGYGLDLIRHDGPEINIVTLAAVFGCLLWVAGEAHRRFEAGRQYAILYQAPGLLLVLGALYLLTFPDFLRELRRLDGPTIHNSPMVLAEMLAMLCLIAVTLGAAPSRLKGGAESVIEIAAGAVLAGLMILVTFLAFPSLSGSGQGASALGILFNLVLFALLVGMIARGYRSSRPLLINAGIIMFALTVATRYVDWFWDMMPRSLFFILGGAVLLGGGILLEKQRRRLVAGAKEVAP